MDNARLALNHGKEERRSTKNVETKRNSFAEYYTDNLDDFEGITKLYDECMLKSDSYYSDRQASLGIGRHRDFLKHTRRYNFAKTRMDNIVRLFDFMGADKVILNVPSVKNNLSINLSEVSERFKNLSKQPIDVRRKTNYEIRKYFGDDMGLKYSYIKKNFKNTPLISLFIFLKIMGYGVLVIDVEPSKKLFGLS